jgi:hypothetical protein
MHFYCSYSLSWVKILILSVLWTIFWIFMMSVIFGIVHFIAVIMPKFFN